MAVSFLHKGVLWAIGLTDTAGLRTAVAVRIPAWESVIYSAGSERNGREASGELGVHFSRHDYPYADSLLLTQLPGSITISTGKEK